MHSCAERWKNEMEGLYEVDFVEWVDEQVRLLRARDFERLDLNELIEELEAMAGNIRRELKSRLIVIMAHLLKCQFQAEFKGHSWMSTLVTQRNEIALLLEQNPSLRRHLEQYAHKAYAAAVRQAANETGLASKAFPADSPYTVEQVLDCNFIP